jgi:general L-amino acid transport system substrate-binding protein
MTSGKRSAWPSSRALATAGALCLAGALPADAGVLEQIRARNHIVCGVADGPKGYSAVTGQGAWSGIGVDFCRALAAGVLGSREAVKFRLLAPGERFSALQAGEIDVIASVAMTSSRDTSLGIRFPGVLVYDGQGFMVRKAQGLASALELSGARICVATESAGEQGVADFFGTLKMPYELLKHEHWPEAAMAYADKSCHVLSAEVSLLAQARQKLPDPAEHIILPELAARELVGPAVRQGDEDWFSVVRWTIYALIAAEELGISAANADAMKASPNAEVRRFLSAGMDHRLGLSADWTQRIVKQIGNYGELFDRNFGGKSALKLERRQNNLAGNGGLHYAPAFR